LSGCVSGCVSGRVSGRLFGGRFLPEQHDLICLGAAFFSLNDVESDRLSFFHGLVAIHLDGAEVDEDVGLAVFASEESVAFYVIEPTNRALIL
jgi:hypothetical protein